ncbi:aminoglycoside phosphotransferase family protein [Mycolicibacterium moriokaense]|nr:aminoglycoside phosphotransferase family protein [Mycolicibacterium moriokaense]
MSPGPAPEWPSDRWLPWPPPRSWRGTSRNAAPGPAVSRRVLSHTPHERFGPDGQARHMGIASLSLLRGPLAEGVLTAAIGECGASLDELRLADVRVHPGGAVRTRYLVDVRRADGRRSREALVAATGDFIPTGATVVAGEHLGEHIEVGVWRLAHDPALPGLKILEEPTRIADLFSASGLVLSGAPTIAVLAYRPAQRAVLAVSAGCSRWFVKVVHPCAVADLRVRHDMLADRLPVPPVLAATSDGLVLLPEAPGTLLRDVLSSSAEAGGVALPAPAEFEKLLDGLPDDLVRLPRRRSILQRVHDSVEVLRMCAESDPSVPAPLAAELASEANRLADKILSTSQAPADAHDPVHGDFYHNQLLTAGGQFTGLLDVDTAGPGERVDDWATLIGYLSVLGMSHETARTYCAEVLGYAERRVPPADLRARAAAVVLGLVPAPFRAQRTDWPSHAAERLALARAWL